jgi:hypothetical protein
VGQTKPEQKRDVAGSNDTTSAQRVRLDCAGKDFYAAYPNLPDRLAIYLPSEVPVRLTPHYQRLGTWPAAGWTSRPGSRTGIRRRCMRATGSAALSTGIEYHPACREMETIAFGDFPLSCGFQEPPTRCGPSPVACPLAW